MFFQPYRNYVITRQIYNERDFGQVWIKAWVRDADTDEALVDGVEMTEATDEIGRFKYTFKLPADPSGNGRQLRVITVVYEDSGYTSRNVNYQVEENNIVVRDMNIMGHSGGGGSDIDYKKVREIVKEELAKLPPYPKLDLSDVIKEIKTSVKSILSQIRAIPEADLTPIEEQIGQLVKAISNIPPAPEPKDFDYSKLEDIKSALKKINTDIVVLEKQPKIERLKDFTEIKKAVSETNKTTELLLNEILDKLDEK
jgi:hypothetical protein